MANKKKKDEALAAVQAQTEENGLSAAQSGYSAAGLGSRAEVEKNALANASYKPSQTVTECRECPEGMADETPRRLRAAIRIRSISFWASCCSAGASSTATPKDPLYRQYEQNYLQNAHNASAMLRHRGQH